MILHSISLARTRTNLHKCASCMLPGSNIASRGIPKVVRRGIGTKYLAKVHEAEREWKEKAQQIWKGEQKSMLSILEERGYVHQIAGKRGELNALMTDKRIGAYVGIDPTAPSLHLGHMIPLMSLFWMYVHGYKSVTLLGGATAKIGDPTGRTQDREKVAATERTENMVRMHFQLKKLWQNVEQYGRRKGYEWEWAWKRDLANNNAWMNKLGIMEILQVLGPGMRMGTMMSRDTVKTKMNSSDGMSFAEFTYPVLQAWDWWHMYDTKKVQLQIGGSDQYGNIVSGIEAINYIRTTHHDPNIRKDYKPVPLNAPFGFTTPLLTNSSGEKIGKSAGNAVWLDGEMTSPFDLYGYWLRQPDEDVERYLKFFTFLPMETIQSAVAEHMKDPKKRTGQHLLAREFVELVHGEQVSRKTEAEHRMMFANPRPEPEVLADVYAKIDEQHNNTIDLSSVGASPTPTVTLPRSIIATKAIGQIIFAAGLVSSRNEGHKLVVSGGAYIGGRGNHKNKMAMNDGAVSWVKIRTWTAEETEKYITNDLLTLRKGKNRIRIVKLVSDEEWEASGKTYPGDGHPPKTLESSTLAEVGVEEDDEPDAPTNSIRNFKGGKKVPREKTNLFSPGEEGNHEAPPGLQEIKIKQKRVRKERRVERLRGTRSRREEVKALYMVERRQRELEALRWGIVDKPRKSKSSGKMIGWKL